LRVNKLDGPTIRKAILQMDDKVINHDTIKEIISLAPTAEEV
jgi:hypothetical protein